MSGRRSHHSLSCTPQEFSLCDTRAEECGWPVPPGDLLPSLTGTGGGGSPIFLATPTQIEHLLR